MKVMYIAPRFHTNQAAVMKGWKEAGHEVCFISHYRGRIEDYSSTTPVIAGYSKVFLFFFHIWMKLFGKRNPRSGDLKLKCGFPSYRKLKSLIREYSPNVVILRERSIYSMVAYGICRQYQYRTILYNQSPLWEREIKNDLPHRLVRRFTPKYRITPVMGNPEVHHAREEHAYFVPFVIEAVKGAEGREYCSEGRICLFSVGKYENRKNHRMLIQVMKELSGKYDLVLTIAGECSTEFHKGYYEGVEELVEELGLRERVRLLKNLTREEMDREYGQADVFVIPSTLEPASVSQLEAMSHALPVLCSDTNGTACYVENGRNGYQFRDNDKEDLKNKLDYVLKDRGRIQDMGRESFRLVKENYGFEGYFRSICEIMNLPVH